VNVRKYALVITTLLLFAAGLSMLSNAGSNTAQLRSITLRVLSVPVIVVLFISGIEYLKSRKSHPWHSGMRFPWKKVLLVFAALLIGSIAVQVAPFEYTSPVLKLCLIGLVVFIVFRDLRWLLQSRRRPRE
jgi:ABC-type transport system involved in cytochrome c biogenesis permease component